MTKILVTTPIRVPVEPLETEQGQVYITPDGLMLITDAEDMVAQLTGVCAGELADYDDYKDYFIESNLVRTLEITVY